MRFRNYINRFNHGNKIFSEDDLWEMTLAKIFANEADIMAQNEDIGIPQALELEASPNTQWVEPFVNDKGENDGGFWQSILQPAYTESIIPEKSRYDSQEIWEFPRSAKEVYTGDMDNVPQESSPTNDKKQSPKIPDEKQKKNEGNPKDVVLEGKVEKEEELHDKNKPISVQEAAPHNRAKDLNIYEDLQKKASKLPSPMSAGDYYGLSTRLADGDEIPEDIKAANDFRKYNDIQDKELKRIFTEKRAEMYKMDLKSPETLKKIQDLNMDIVMPKVDSKLYRQIKDSETMQRWVAENYDKINNVALQRQSSSVAFPEGFRKKFDLFSTIHRADLHNSKINPDGSLSTLLNDGYDFEKMEYSQLNDNKNFRDLTQKMLRNMVVKVNNAAYNQQEANQLKRYLLTQPIWYSKEELEDILRKYYR